MATKLKKECLSFNEIFISPQYSDIESRENIDTSSLLGPLKLELPIISANMPSITGVDMAVKLSEYGCLGILPRFDTIENAVTDFDCAYREIENLGFKSPVGVSVGVQSHDKERFKALHEAGARLFCIDVAHGDHILVKNMLEWIRNIYGEYDSQECWDGKDLIIQPIVIAGNVASYSGLVNLKNWGADVVKVGIGPGEVCQTRRNTGVGVPQFGVLEEIHERCLAYGTTLPPIISDGGVKFTGDISKALIFSDAVMLGKMIAGTVETPGCVYEDENGSFYKKFGGSASGENKVAHGGRNKFVEGHMTNVPFRGKVQYILNKIKEGLQSAMSYTGSRNIAEYKENVIYGTMSSGGMSESKLN